MDHATIALLTDFGRRDAYAGIMTGVLASCAPDARVIDLTHEIPAGDVRAAAFVLWQAVPYLPTGSVCLAVVDPGVGTRRRPIALRLPNGFGVGPDNGLFSWLLCRGDALDAVEIDPTRVSSAIPSATFHGRDVFAPAAARLALGAPLSDLGPTQDDIVRLNPPGFQPIAGGVTGEIVWIDSFGNAVTSLGRLRLSGDHAELTPCWQPSPPTTFRTAPARLALRSGTLLPLLRTFADVSTGEPLAYVGSSGLIELGIHRGHAATVLGLAPGQAVTLLFEG
jgi:S-adenosylmethionine hydrolase